MNYSEEYVYKRILFFQQKNNYSVFQFCTKTGISLRTYKRWRTGETMPHLKTMIIIADFFNISVEILLKSPLGGVA